MKTEGGQASPGTGLTGETCPQFVIPGLFPEIPDTLIPRLPHLERALARGNLTVSRSDRMLEDWPDADGDVSLAARMAREAGLLHQAPHWLCADPIHLHVEGDALVLLERYSFSVSEAESTALVETLNQYFFKDGLQFYALSPDVWLVGLHEAPRISTTHPLSRVGRTIDGYLPQGEDAKRWRFRFNEVQMLLHEHPVNQLREARRERLISGVWFWDTPAAIHAARVIETLRAPSAYGDAEAWQAAALALDRDILGPALQELRTGKLKTLTLIAVEGRCAATLTLSRWHLWRFWRRARPLAQLPGIPALEHA
ncbi:MAG: hypothetical protein KGK17_00735 [Betaproteobacteria bacterium]|nr:hypothetical protein [Betaproteobacteria bacterium]